MRKTNLDESGQFFFGVPVWNFLMQEGNFK